MSELQYKHVDPTSLGVPTVDLPSNLQSDKYGNYISPTDTVAALRFLAAVCGQPRETPLSDEEAYGMEVLLNLIADKVEGRAAP